MANVKIILIIVVALVAVGMVILMSSGSSTPSQDGGDVDPCITFAGSDTNIGPACYAKLWKGAGCTTVATYGDWHKGQTLDALAADSKAWATLTDADHKKGCYGTA